MYSCRHNLVFSKSQYVFRRCLKTFTSIWHRQEIWLSWEKAGKITVDKLHSAHVCVPDKPLPTWHGKRKPSLISSVTCCRCYCSVISCVDQLLDLSVLRKIQFCSLCTFLYTHSFLSSSFFSLWLSCLQKTSCDRPSSDGEATHENGHSDCKDQGESHNDSCYQK